MLLLQKLGRNVQRVKGCTENEENIALRFRGGKSAAALRISFLFVIHLRHAA